jgi:hypothetical protein
MYTSPGKRRRNSKRAMYPESMAFPDSFLITKAVDISLDDNVSPAGDQGNMTNDLRACLGEATPKRVGRQSSSAGKRREADPKKHWSEYYRAAVTSDDSVDEGMEKNFVNNSKNYTIYYIYTGYLYQF